MARVTEKRAPRWAARVALALCVYAAGSVGCSSDSRPDGVPPGEEPSGDAGSDGLAGSDVSGGGKAGNGGAGNLGQAGDADGGSEGSDLALGAWDSSFWDEALWQ